MRPMSRTKKTTKIRYWMGTKQGPVQKDWKTHRTRHWRHQDEDQDKDKKQDANQIKTMYCTEEERTRSRTLGRRWEAG